MVLSCPVPKPHYSARPKRFGSRGPSKNVRLGYVTENELTDKDWKNAVQGLGKVLSTILEASKNWNIGSGPGRGGERRVRRRERKKAFRQSL